MSWFEKGTPLSFENEPISGLFFLDGDLVAKTNPVLDWHKGHKYPLLVFPSGAMCRLGENTHSLMPPVYLSEGDLALPFNTSRDDAFTHVTEMDQPLGYAVRKVGEDVLEMSGDDHERIQIVYDNTAQRMTDVVYLHDEDASVEALRRREQIDENENPIERNAALDRYEDELAEMQEEASLRRERARLSQVLSPQAEHLLTLKDEILGNFRDLPPEHQAIMGLALLKTAMEGEWGAWLSDALARTYFDGDLFPSIDRDDLRGVHLSEEEIARLSDADLSTIAEQMRNHYVNDLFADELRFHAEEQLETGHTDQPTGEATPPFADANHSFPTNSIAKEDLLYCRPDLAAQIEALADSDMNRIANKVGDALQDLYWMAVQIVLAEHLHVEVIDAHDINKAETDNFTDPTTSS